MTVEPEIAMEIGDWTLTERGFSLDRLAQAESVLDPIAGLDLGRRFIGADFLALQFSLMGSRHLHVLVLIRLTAPVA